jgi:hypothetical protein
MLDFAVFVLISNVNSVFQYMYQAQSDIVYYGYRTVSPQQLQYIHLLISLEKSRSWNGWPGNSGTKTHCVGISKKPPAENLQKGESNAQ